MTASVAFRSVLFFGALISCLGRDRASADPAVAPSPAKSATFDVKGIVQEVKPEALKVVIAHEAIRGYMDAMTMEFRVKSAEELRGIQRGDRIAFQLCVTANTGWIERVQKITGSATTASPVPSIAEFATKAGPELKAGDPIPDAALVDQSGKQVRLSAMKGEAFAFTFIFTRCPYPEFCPLMNNNLREVQSALLASKAGGKWRLLSISIDPAYDTPERLAEYAKAYGADPMRWSFLTGESAEIKKLAGSFGLTVFGEGAAIQHNLRTVVVDARGIVQRIFIGNEWKAADVIAEMEAAMKAEN